MKKYLYSLLLIFLLIVSTSVNAKSTQNFKCIKYVKSNGQEEYYGSSGALVDFNTYVNQCNGKSGYCAFNCDTDKYFDALEEGDIKVSCLSDNYRQHSNQANVAYCGASANNSYYARGCWLGANVYANCLNQSISWSLGEKLYSNQEIQDYIKNFAGSDAIHTTQDGKKFVSDITNAYSFAEGSEGFLLANQILQKMAAKSCAVLNRHVEGGKAQLYYMEYMNNGSMANQFNASYDNISFDQGLALAKQGKTILLSLNVSGGGTCHLFTQGTHYITLTYDRNKGMYYVLHSGETSPDISNGYIDESIIQGLRGCLGAGGTHLYTPGICHDAAVPNECDVVYEIGSTCTCDYETGRAIYTSSYTIDSNPVTISGSSIDELKKNASDNKITLSEEDITSCQAVLPTCQATGSCEINPQSTSSEDRYFCKDGTKCNEQKYQETCGKGCRTYCAEADYLVTRLGGDKIPKTKYFCPNENKTASVECSYYKYEKECLLTDATTCKPNCEPNNTLAATCDNFADTAEQIGNVSDINQTATTCNNDENQVLSCAVDGTDLVGQEYSYEKDNHTFQEKRFENKYCSIWCVEDYSFTLPTARYTQSGSAFKLNVGVSGKRSCYVAGGTDSYTPSAQKVENGYLGGTSGGGSRTGIGIDTEKFEDDLSEEFAKMYNYYDEYTKYRLWAANIYNDTSVECVYDEYEECSTDSCWTVCYDEYCHNNYLRTEARFWYYEWDVDNKTLNTYLTRERSFEDTCGSKSDCDDNSYCTDYWCDPHPCPVSLEDKKTEYLRKASEYLNKLKYSIANILSIYMEYNACSPIGNQDLVNTVPSKVLNYVGKYFKNYRWPWSNDFKFDPTVEFKYDDQSKFFNESDYVELTDTNDHYKKSTTTYCVGDVDEQYNCKGTTSDTMPTYDSKPMLCFENGCYDTYEGVFKVNKAERISIVKEEGVSYSASGDYEQFYTKSPFGTIYDKRSGNGTYSKIMSESLPVSLNGKTKMYEFSFRFSDIGQYNSTGILGRLVNAKTSDKTVLSVYKDMDKTCEAKHTTTSAVTGDSVGVDYGSARRIVEDSTISIPRELTDTDRYDESNYCAESATINRSKTSYGNDVITEHSKDVDEFEVSDDGAYLCGYVNNCDNCNFTCQDGHCDICDGDHCDGTPTCTNCAFTCKNCIIDDGRTNYRFKSISLNNVFPNKENAGEVGYNWDSTVNKKAQATLEGKFKDGGKTYNLTSMNGAMSVGESAYEKPEFSVTITPANISKIKKLNKSYGFDNVTADELKLTCTEATSSNQYSYCVSGCGESVNILCKSNFISRGEALGYFTENKTLYDPLNGNIRSAYYNKLWGDTEGGGSSNQVNRAERATIDNHGIGCAYR